MREIRTSGSEGGGAKTLPTPIGLRSEAGKVLILSRFQKDFPDAP